MLPLKTVRKLIFQINFLDERKCGDVYGKRKKLKAVKHSSAKRTQRNSENGAKASNRVQKNKKLLREAAELLLATSADNDTKVMLKSCRIATNACAYAMAVVVAQLKKAIAGDTKAFIAIRDVLGENPKAAEQENFNEDKSIVINVVPASERCPE